MPIEDNYARKRTFNPTVQKKISRLLFQNLTLVQSYGEYMHSSRGRKQKGSTGIAEFKSGEITGSCF